MLSWETTLAHGFPWDQFNRLCAIDTVNGRFFRAISQETAQRLQNTFTAPPTSCPIRWRWPSPFSPTLIQQCSTHYVTVELNGAQTRGQTVIDYNGISGKAPNVNIIQRLDTDGVYDLFAAALSQS